MFNAIFKAFITLIEYVLIGILAGFFGLPFLPFISKKRRNIPFRVWYLIDVTICTIVHNTSMRTISGWTGQHRNHLKRFEYLASLIDWLFEVIAKEKNHCALAYRYERAKGYV